MRQVISREVAITEVWLDRQAELSEASFPRIPARVWISELGKAAVWFVGLVIVLVLMLLLAPESKADSIPMGRVTSYIARNSDLPLAVGVAGELAQNLITAQNETWGNVWQTGSLKASEDAVLKAISLYDVAIITDECCDGVWVQSRIAIDTTLTVVFGPTLLNLGEAPIATPEPATWASLCLGIVGIGLMRWKYRPTMGQRMRTRLREYRGIRLV